MTRLGTRTVTAAELPSRRAPEAGGRCPQGVHRPPERTSAIAVAGLLALGYAVVALVVVEATFVLALTVGP